MTDASPEAAELPRPCVGGFKAAYNVQEAAELLPVGIKRLYELCRSNEIECFKVGHQFVIPHWAIQNWLKAGVAARKAELEARMKREFLLPSLAPEKVR